MALKRTLLNVKSDAFGEAEGDDMNITEALRLGAKDKRVIKAFIAGEPMEGQKLSTDGKTLDGHWMGGRGIAHKRLGDQIVFVDLGSHAAQKVQQAIRDRVPAGQIIWEAKEELTRAERKKKNKALWKKMSPEDKLKFTGDKAMPSAPADAKKKYGSAKVSEDDSIDESFKGDDPTGALSPKLKSERGMRGIAMKVKRAKKLRDKFKAMQEEDAEEMTEASYLKMGPKAALEAGMRRLDGIVNYLKKDRPMLAQEVQKGVKALKKAVVWLRYKAEARIVSSEGANMLRSAVVELEGVYKALMDAGYESSAELVDQAKTHVSLALNRMRGGVRESEDITENADLFKIMSASLRDTLELGLKLNDGDKKKAIAFAKKHTTAGRGVWRAVLKDMGLEEDEQRRPFDLTEAVELKGADPIPSDLYAKTKGRAKALAYIKAGNNVVPLGLSRDIYMRGFKIKATKFALQPILRAGFDIYPLGGDEYEVNLSRVGKNIGESFDEARMSFGNWDELPAAQARTRAEHSRQEKAAKKLIGLTVTTVSGPGEDPDVNYSGKGKITKVQSGRFGVSVMVKFDDGSREVFDYSSLKLPGKHRPGIGVFVHKKGTVIESLQESVASTILQQLGGNKFIAMTGAKNLFKVGKGLQFDIGRNAHKISRVMIKLDPDDTYTMKFYRGRGMRMKEVESYSGVYADMLQELFTQETGMYTRL